MNFEQLLRAERDNERAVSNLKLLSLCIIIMVVSK